MGITHPRSKGGAIETLIDSLIEENEQRQELELIVVSSADSAIPSLTKHISLAKSFLNKLKNVLFGEQ